jgi:hypothetical protein
MGQPTNLGREGALEKELSTSEWPAAIRIEKNEGRTPLARHVGGRGPKSRRLRSVLSVKI